jgi:hypothetical protein
MDHQYKERFALICVHSRLEFFFLKSAAFHSLLPALRQRAMIVYM